jgi:preprotein translocase subunit SecE
VGPRFRPVGPEWAEWASCAGPEQRGVRMLSAEGETAVAKAQTNRPPNAIVRYFRETGGEMRKVSWPTRQEAINLTIVVLIVTVATSLVLGALDYVFTDLFRLIISL